jgi:hypothetical protein
MPPVVDPGEPVVVVGGIVVVVIPGGGEVFVVVVVVPPGIPPIVPYGSASRTVRSSSRSIWAAARIPGIKL